MLRFTSFILLLASAFSLQAQEELLPPNIVVFSLNGFGPGDLNSSIVDLPNLRELQQQSLKFENFYTSSPEEQGQFFSIFTGQHSGLHPARQNQLKDSSPVAWPIAKQSLPILLKQANYQTAFYGYWPFASEEKQKSTSAWGFNNFCGWEKIPRYSSRFPQFYLKDDKRIPLESNPEIPSAAMFNLHDNIEDKKLFQRYTGKQLDSVLMQQEALNFLQKQDTKTPFFLCIHSPLLSTPIQETPARVAALSALIPDVPYLGQQGGLPLMNPRAVRAAQLQRLDQQIGQLRNRLRQQKMLQNTVFLFVSLSVPEPGILGSSDFFSSIKAGKGHRYELRPGGLQTVCLLSAPGIKPAQIQEHCWLPDLAPTLAGFCDIPWKEQALSQALPLSRQAPAANREFYWEFNLLRAWQQGDQRLVQKAAYIRPQSQKIFVLQQELWQIQPPAESGQLSPLLQHIDELRRPVTLGKSYFDK